MCSLSVCVCLADCACRYSHVLLEYSDPELIDIVTVATKRKLCVSSSRISSYKEVQVNHTIHTRGRLCGRSTSLLVCVRPSPSSCCAVCLPVCFVSLLCFMQYHGPVEFGRDVEALVVNWRHASDKAMMRMCEDFCKNNKCNLVMMEPHR